MFGRGSYRDGGGRSVEGGHISQRIKGTEGNLHIGFSRGWSGGLVFPSL